MLRSCLAFFLLLLPSYAATTTPLSETGIVDLKMQLKIDGQPVATPEIKTPFGKRATITQSIDGEATSYSIQVEPLRHGEEVLVKCVITRSGADGIKIIGTPKMFVMNHASASFGTTIDKGPNTYELNITSEF